MNIITITACDLTELNSEADAFICLTINFGS